jgi:hypothetical protein
MTKPPEHWPRISSGVFYEDAAKAIDWLCRAFGFEVRLKVEGEGGRIEHSELTFADGLIMVGSAGRPNRPDRSYCRHPEHWAARTRSRSACKLRTSMPTASEPVRQGRRSRASPPPLTTVKSIPCTAATRLLTSKVITGGSCAWCADPGAVGTSV